MKKILFALMVLPLLFSSCKKDKFNEEVLDGTSWKASYQEDYYDGTYSKNDITIKFSSTTAVITVNYKYKGTGEYDDQDESGTYVVNGTYDYSHPNVTFIAVDSEDEDEDDEYYMLTGIIDGNTMTVNMDGEVITFKYKS